jgi:hypothetical protein
MTTPNNTTAAAAAAEKAAPFVSKPRSLSVFLELAPVLSTSPSDASSRATSVSTSSVARPVLTGEVPASAVDMSTPADASERTNKNRRSSSVSSTSSGRRRFLKLGPVHFGGDPLESDFVDVEDA